MRIMFDLDGVLSDFVAEFRAYAGLPEDWYPQKYNLDKALEHRGDDCKGVWFSDGKSVYNSIIERMKMVRNFWTTLAPLVTDEDTDAIRGLYDAKNEFGGKLFSRHQWPCFITSRFSTRGEPVNTQTRRWVLREIFSNGITGWFVSVTNDKVSACKELNITHALEDSPEQALKLNRAGVKCWLIDRPYNRNVYRFVKSPPVKFSKNWDQTDPNVKIHTVPIVKTVAEFCKIVLENQGT